MLAGNDAEVAEVALEASQHVIEVVYAPILGKAGGEVVECEPDEGEEFFVKGDVARIAHPATHCRTDAETILP